MNVVFMLDSSFESERFIAFHSIRFLEFLFPDCSEIVGHSEDVLHKRYWEEL